METSMRAKVSGLDKLIFHKLDSDLPDSSKSPGPSVDKDLVLEHP
jgi:hypothetical protein